ncbi:M23 family metallopeptidase [Aquipseudomonas campi]|uniref:M23 family metallopeptidase n=1 Tax=Aquipseudomonas campi TaxID=2731681 RepID=A0A6M8FEA5_9GAMM|nr:M23 family metallopeptidase [Pseudomonas campi]QKE62522.1 M23 family metallopeptidase [Pseudomonas campi]
MNISALQLTSFLLAALLSCTSFSQEMYKYKDSNGKWVFSDKRPAETAEVESLDYKETKKSLPKPRIYTQQQDGWHYLIADNPFHAPVEFRVLSSAFESGTHTYIAPSTKQEIIHKSRADIPPFRYGWQLGDPATQEVNYLYKSPVSSRTTHKITQSFKGAFSHTDAANLYAVDIAMPVGTYISAAREGTVIWTKDDYHMSGKTGYFLDKANYIQILHDDGTYAVYAHLLLGSAKVQPGDKVKVGDILARSGSSGYSTGPHLHFVVRKNAGLTTASIPFRFVDQNGTPFIPQRGMKLAGVADSF